MSSTQAWTLHCSTLTPTITAGSITALLGTVLVVGYAGLADANVGPGKAEPLGGTHQLD